MPNVDGIEGSSAIGDGEQVAISLMPDIYGAEGSSTIGNVGQAVVLLTPDVNGAGPGSCFFLIIDDMVTLDGILNSCYILCVQYHSKFESCASKTNSAS